MPRVAIIIEGGLISSDLIEQIAATPQDVQGQRPADFGLDGRLSDEIQKAFSDALFQASRALKAFQRRAQHALITRSRLRAAICGAGGTRISPCGGAFGAGAGSCGLRSERSFSYFP